MYRARVEWNLDLCRGGEVVLKTRLERVQKALQECGLDAVALLPGANLRYLTGVSFHSTERSLVGFFPAEGEPGMTEQAIANLIQIEILATGGIPSFALVQGGETSAQPHAEGGDRRVAAGEPLLVDWGAMVGGYSADITRTFAMAGEPDPRLTEIAELVKAANLAGRRACAPGVPAEEVDRATRQVIEKGGYGEQFFHRTGHGLGLDIHEEPYIVEGNTTPLAVGNVFTVEPGIYVEGLGGVRIEDDVVITNDGAETLTSFNHDLQIVGS
jgi:Xaa-Pro dipeptidase